MGVIPVAEDAVGKYKYNTSSVSGFQGAAIMDNSQNKDVAWKYIRFITSPVVQRGYLVEMPVWKSVQKSVYAQQNFPTIKVKSKELASVHHRPKVPNYQEVSSILQRYIHQCLEILELLLGFFIATILNKNFKGRNIVRSLILIPWAVPTVVNARVWQWIYNANSFGALNRLLKDLNITNKNIVWLQETVPFKNIGFIHNFLNG